MSSSAGVVSTVSADKYIDSTNQGENVANSEAIKQAADLIQKAKSPLICGMSQSATQAQRAAVCLADQIGATIDSGASSTTRALQQVGEASCTLGEVRSRADLIICWGAHELLTNQCFMQSLDSQSDQVPRTIVAMGADLPECPEHVDNLMTLEAQKEFEVIWSLRALMKGIDLNDRQPAGISAADLKMLMDLILQSSYIVFFFGPEFKQGHLSHRNIEALSLLVREIQSDRSVMRLVYHLHMKQKGLENVMAWQTGYAACINFASGYPRYSPVEYSVNRLLEQNEIDLCILVGDHSINGLSQDAARVD